ncbi:MAG TPA: DUF4238 domain-containing protein [Jatrophihabitans sp.]|nr:DUF4238 domain-containing protein [Jatrophihabitans sp.]
MTDSYEALQERVDALARQIMDRIPRSNGVGSRHHTVPRFLLEPFSSNGQVAVHELVTDKRYVGSIKDLAITDFYTVVVDVPGEGGGPAHAYDGRIETILANMEGTAARAIREFRLTPAAITADMRAALAQFASFQYVRGTRSRAEFEVLIEYGLKLTHSAVPVRRKTQHRADVQAARRAGRTPARGNRGTGRRPSARNGSTPTARELRDWIIRPHQNEFLRDLGKRAEMLYDCLINRPLTIMTLAGPWLVIGDEPLVIVDDQNYVEHRPQCLLSDRERARRWNKAVKQGRPVGDLVHLYNTRPRGLLDAEEVALPIAPDTLLLWGPEGQSLPVHITLTVGESRDVATELNRRQAADAFLWIAAHPDNAEFNSLPVPPRGPVLTVCDYDSAARDAVRTFPGRPLRLRHKDVLRRA